VIHNVLTDIGGIGLYGLVSMLLFFAVFLGMLAWATRLKKPYLRAMGALPLDPDRPDAPAEEGDPRHDA